MQPAVFRKAFGVICAALVATTLLAGASVAQTTLHRGNGSEPLSLDPARAVLDSEWNVLRDLYEGLTVHDAAGRVQPGAAESWTVSGDGLVYTFTIRANADWSNGDPVTADDFVRAFRRILDPAEGAGYANVLFPIANAEAINTATAEAPVAVETLGVRALNPKTLEVTLARPTPFLPELLAHPVALPVHGETADEAAVTNGAFVLSERVASDHITLRKSPGYWDAANVSLDGVVFYPTEDQAGAIRRFATGELDVNTPIPADQVSELNATFGAEQMRVSPSLAATSIAYDTRQPPFPDARVRRALDLAIDRVALARIDRTTASLPLDSVVPDGIPAYEPARSESVGLSEDKRVTAARDLLREAGYGDGGQPLTVNLRFNTGADRDAAAAAIAEDWRAIGVTVTTTASGTEEHYAALRSGEPFGAALVAWTADYADPSAFLTLYASDNLTFNFGGWRSAAFDDLIARSNVETDPETRARLLREAEALLLTEQPVTPLTVNVATWLVSPKVKGWQDNAANDHRSRFLSRE